MSEEKELGFHACFYCVNAHHLGWDCKCACHEEETEEMTKQNQEWLVEFRKRMVRP